MLFIWLLIIQLVIFAVLVVFLRTIMARNIQTATSHLNEVNRDFTQKMEESKKRFQEAERYYDEMVLKAKMDAEKLKAQILNEARDAEETLLKDARQRSEEIVQQANKAGEVLTQEIDEKIDERSIDKACELAQSVLSESSSKELHDRWVEELLKNGFEELGRLNLSKDSQEVKVVSAYPLTSDQKAEIQKRIKEKVKREVKLREAVDPHLVAGLKMTLGSVDIDGSLRFRLRERARRARHSS